MTHQAHTHETCHHDHAHHDHHGHDHHGHDHHHEHDHAHGHHHDHNHNSPGLIAAYFVGLALYIVALLIPQGFLKNTLYVATLLFSGLHIILEGFQDTYYATKSNHKFTPNVHVLMTLAAFGAIIIGEYQEAALLILIFAGAHFLEGYAEGRSKKEITNLLKLKPTQARLLNQDGSITLVDVSTLKIGDHLQVLSGDQIATDGFIISGWATIDQSSITGESIPVDKQTGDLVFGSTINGNTVFEMEVSKDSSDTVFAKIVALVSQAQSNISKTAVLIKRIEPIYVTGVLIAAPIFYILGLSVFGWDHTMSFYRTMVMLIVASPCALAATDIPATLSAISNLAKRGVLFKGGSYLSNLSDIKVVAFDKTGTLTEGKPVVTDVQFTDALDPKQQKQALNIFVNMERKSNHPLADAITAHFKDEPIHDIEVINLIGSGLSARYDSRSYIIGKPSVFSDINADIQSKTRQLEDDGKTVIYLSIDSSVVGLIAIQDIPKQSAAHAIQYFKDNNVHTVMLTGDAKQTGEAIGKQLGIDEIIANVLPEDKATIITSLQSKHGPIAMLGDGVNDAPALVNADIGVAMGDGTDIAIDAADAVLMENDLSKFVYTHKLSKKLRRVVIQNIIFAMGVVVFLLIMNIIGQMDMWFAVLMHEGSTILVILSGLRLLKGIQE